MPTSIVVPAGDHEIGVGNLPSVLEPAFAEGDTEKRKASRAAGPVEEAQGASPVRRG